MITIDAPAKINLTLRVLARRTDGFHSLETTLCAISLRDTIVVSHGPAGSGVRLMVDGEHPTDDPADNLVVRAARAFADAVGVDPDFEIQLTKRIPAAAGLGGGSSDAAATLLALGTLVPGAARRSRLLELAAELGSDVPFFLCGSAHALAWGRGERILALPPLPSRPILIAHPGVPISTADAFRELAQTRGEAFGDEPHVHTLERLSGWRWVEEQAANDFQEFATRSVPRIADGLHALRESGASIAMLAGSGASIFGIYGDDEDAAIAAAADRLASIGFRTWQAHTLESTPAGRRSSEASGPSA